MTIHKKALTLGITVGIMLLLLFSSFTSLSAQQANNGSLPYTINTYGPSWEGLIAFNLRQNGNSSANYLVIMDSNGTIVSIRQADSNYDGAIYEIAPNTLLFEGEPGTDLQDTVWTTCATHIWNFITNTTQDFPNVVSEHDIQYNPDDGTFLVLRDYIRQIGGKSILFDKIMQVDSNGMILWTWDTYDHIPLSQASQFNETSKTKITGNIVEDFTHANTLDWDYNNGVIYLNLRNTNTFYKIDQSTGNIIWACGEFGNFTLLDDKGNAVSNLWYHSHDVKQIAPGVFTMFDNDYRNNTNPNDCHSALLELTLNEETMTASVNWRWDAPKQYWNSYGGSTSVLPNGDYLGAFGVPTHQLTQNQPWNFTDTGAVLIEVNPAGQIVKTITFPVGWYIYRAEPITNQSSEPSVTPTIVSPDSKLSLTYSIFAAAVVVTIVAVLGSVLYLQRTKKLEPAK